MAKLYNLARVSTATTGTGTITLGSAVSGYLTFALAGVQDGDVVDYAINDGGDSEIGTGTYTSSGTTLSRTVTKSTNSNSAISLSGSAEVFISPRAETLNDASLLTTGKIAAARVDALSTASGSPPSYSARAWGVFTGITSATLLEGGNIASVTRAATGQYDVVFTTAMPDANYSTVFSVGRVGGSGAISVIGPEASAPTVNGFRITGLNSAFSAADARRISFAVFR